jgi:hypothetical protein
VYRTTRSFFMEKLRGEGASRIDAGILSHQCPAFNMPAAKRGNG